MYYTGFADEAAHSIDGQIRATKELGWKWIESRKIDGANIHDIPAAAFDEVCRKLEGSGVGINCFGSAIANWGKKIDEPGTSSLEEVERAIPRMKRLGTKLIRIMSYAVLPGKPPQEQLEDERFRRLNELTRRFLDAGIQPVHENCMNYGGMGWRYSLRIVERVPGLKLVFDTGNCVHSDDVDAPAGAGGARPRQSSWDFYTHVRDHIAYVHIKDARWDAVAGHGVHTFPGEGQADVARIVADLLARGYDGGFSMEPHLAVVHHDPSLTSPESIMYANYVDYGRRFMRIVDEIRAKAPAGNKAAR